MNDAVAKILVVMALGVGYACYSANYYDAGLNAIVYDHVNELNDGEQQTELYKNQRDTSTEYLIGWGILAVLAVGMFQKELKIMWRTMMLGMILLLLHRQPTSGDSAYAPGGSYNKVG